jgi:hypothetical protein
LLVGADKSVPTAAAFDKPEVPRLPSAAPAAWNDPAPQSSPALHLVPAWGAKSPAVDVVFDALSDQMFLMAF